MSEGLNMVVVAGNLTEDPALRFTQGGQAVLNLRIAIGERFKDRDGEWKDRTEYVPAVVWGKRAEALGNILSKGSAVTVTGSLRTTSYEKDGSKRYKTEINADKVILGGKGNGGARGADAPPGGGRSAGGRGAPAPPDDHGGYSGNPDDDIPFATCDISHDLKRWGL